MFGATVITPSASILNGPVVETVTSVLAVVTATPLIVSFVITVPGTIVGVDPVVTVTAASSNASIMLVIVKSAALDCTFAQTKLDSLIITL